MQLKLLRHGADRKCLGSLLHNDRALYFELCALCLFQAERPALTQNLVRRTKLKDRFTPVPSPLADSQYSSAHTCAATLSSLPKLLSARLPALLQTDRRECSDRARTARRAAAGETSGPTECPGRCAIALCR